MKVDLKKIINIKNREDLKSYPINKPIFKRNFLFHYLILLGNLSGLKLEKFPIYIENNDGLNGFHLAAKESNTDILKYLMKEYPDYIYNQNNKKEMFTYYLPPEEIIELINEFPKLDWENLLLHNSKKSYSVYQNIVNNLNFNQLKTFFKLIKIPVSSENQYLDKIMINNNLSLNNKFELLDKFSDDELNIKSPTGEGLILIPIMAEDDKMFDYLLKRKVDLYYFTFISTLSPLYFAIFKDIFSGTINFSKKIIDNIIQDNKTFYKDTNKLLENLGHVILNIRINKNSMIDEINNELKNDYNVDSKLLSYLDNEAWNQYNINKISPLELITNLDFDKYHKIISEIKITKRVLNKIKNENNINKKWIKFLESLEELKEENDIDILNNKYAQSTLFQSKFLDVGLFILYLNKKYKEIYIPNLKSYSLNNLTFEDTFPFSDDLVNRESFFPWIISYHNEYEYHIHPYLNNLINSQRRENKERYTVVFISLIYENLLHANILLYDLKNMTIERFEPYGNSNLVDNNLDDILEEELTWSTGLKYLRPKDYLPYSSFQTISDENNPYNKKAGDFGGFCLAWCLWYIELRLKNPEIEPKILVLKAISKLSNSELKFIEHIRNYSNKINEYRIKYSKHIGISNKEISNSYLSIENSEKYTKFLINKFNGSLQ
jgi:hypothetical protein